jgi:anti-sigma-K factor RskA
MSSTEHDPGSRACGTDVAAYALGALEPAEAEAFRRHLETCTVCREELASFQEVVNVLPLTAPQHRAPRAVRRRVMAAVAADDRSARAGVVAGAGAPRRRGLASWFGLPRPAMALASALAVVAVAIGTLELGSSGSSSVRIYHAQVTGSPGTAEVRVTGGHAELILHRVAPPPAGHIYEVWLGRAGRAPEPTSALFSVTAGGDGDVDVPGSLRGVNLVMVTPEPLGGSRVPTHAAVISARLA